jgi:hypothetical protein
LSPSVTVLLATDTETAIPSEKSAPADTAMLAATAVVRTVAVSVAWILTL